MRSYVLGFQGIDKTNIDAIVLHDPHRIIWRNTQHQPDVVTSP